MPRPTRHKDDELSVGAEVSADSALVLSRIMQQAEEFESKLHQKRISEYRNRESIFNVDSEELYYHESLLFPPETATHIDGVNIGLWGDIYEDYLFPINNTHNVREKVVENKNNRRRIEGKSITFNINSIENISSDEIELNIDESNSIQLFFDRDIELGRVTDYDFVEIRKRSDEEVRILNNAGQTDAKTLNIAFFTDVDSGTREYIDKSVPQVEPVKENLSELQSADTMDKRDQAVRNCLSENYLSSAQKLYISYLISGVKDTIRIDYGYSVPYVIDKLISLYGWESSHIPQTGDIMISEHSLSDLDYLSKEFPSKQVLNDEDEIKIRKQLGHPQESIDFYMNGVAPSIQELESLANMVDSGFITRKEVSESLQFVDYPIPPQESMVKDAIKIGNRYRKGIENLREDKYNIGEPVLQDIKNRRWIIW